MLYSFLSKLLLPSLTMACFLFAPALLNAQSRSYFPPAGDKWEKRKPEAVGMDGEKLAKAVAFAQANETDFPRDFSTQEKIFGRRLGPLPAARSGTSGLVLRHGYVIAQWGDTRHADPTYSAAKSFLSTLLGIALDRKLIDAINEPVGKLIHDGGYDAPHNAKITWKNHAQQNSEWEGEMWGKASDFIGEREFGEGRRPLRDLREPSAFFEYNDVRINRLALSLLRVWKRPLPDVLQTEVMNSIGASKDWRWIPYPNANAEVDGKMLPSVSGGTRWGGGLWISAEDEARFGLLFLNRGKWKNRQIVSELWVKDATTPSATNPAYGYLWWLNTDGKMWPGTPTSAFAAVGAGSNTIWIDPQHDLVVVWRWHRGNGAELFRQVVEAVK